MTSHDPEKPPKRLRVVAEGEPFVVEPVDHDEIEQRIALANLQARLIDECRRNGTLVVTEDPDGSTRFTGTVVVNADGWLPVKRYTGTA